MFQEIYRNFMECNETVLHKPHPSDGKVNFSSFFLRNETVLWKQHLTKYDDNSNAKVVTRQTIFHVFHKPIGKSNETIFKKPHN